MSAKAAKPAKVVALLRGVNVGGNRKVPMATLRALAEGLGFTDPRTYVNSGNIVFEAPFAPAEAAKRLEAALAKELGFAVDVVARAASEWARYARGSPFPDEAEKDGRFVHLVLSKAPPPEGAAKALLEKAKAGERIEARGDAVWIHFPDGVGRSKLTPQAIDRALGSPATARNWRTVVALQEMLAGEEA